MFVYPAAADAQTDCLGCVKRVSGEVLGVGNLSGEDLLVRNPVREDVYTFWLSLTGAKSPFPPS